MRSRSATRPRSGRQESLFALASIYGIELLEDNHRDAKAIMLAEFLRLPPGPRRPLRPGHDLQQAAAFLIDTNIVRGNTLTGLDWRGEEIQFSWWNRIAGAPGMVQREPFTLASLRDDAASTSPSTTATGLAGSTRSTRK